MTLKALLLALRSFLGNFLSLLFIFVLLGIEVRPKRVKNSY